MTRYTIIPSLEDDLRMTGNLKEERAPSSGHEESDGSYFFDRRAPLNESSKASSEAPLNEHADVDIDPILRELDEDFDAIGAASSDPDIAEGEVLDFDSLLEMSEGILSESKHGKGMKEGDDADGDDEEGGESDDSMDEEFGPERDHLKMGSTGDKSPLIPERYMKMYVAEAAAVGVELDPEALAEAYDIVEELDSMLDARGYEPMFEAYMGLSGKELVEMYVDASSKLMESEVSNFESLQIEALETVVEARGLQSAVADLLYERRKRMTGAGKRSLERYKRSGKGRRKAKIRSKLNKSIDTSTISGKRRMQKALDTAFKSMGGLKSKTIGKSASDKRRLDRQHKMLAAGSGTPMESQEFEAESALDEAEAVIAGLAMNEATDIMEGFARIAQVSERLVEAFELYAGVEDNETLREVSERFSKIVEGADAAIAVIESGNFDVEQADAIYEQYLSTVYSGLEIYEELNEQADTGMLKKYLGISSDDSGAPVPSAALDRFGQREAAKNTQKDGVRPFTESTDFTRMEMFHLYEMSKSMMEKYGSKKVSEMSVDEMKTMLGEMGMDAGALGKMSKEEMASKCEGYMASAKEIAGKK